MDIQKLAEEAVQEIKALKQNKIYYDFIYNESLEKTSSDMNEAGNSTTPKGVELMSFSRRNIKIKERIEQYINAGFVGLYMTLILNKKPNAN